MSEIEKLLPYSCKIEADQKCLKISTHVHGDNGGVVVTQAANMWLEAKLRLEKEGFKVAPL